MPDQSTPPENLSALTKKDLIELIEYQRQAMADGGAAENSVQRNSPGTSQSLDINEAGTNNLFDSSAFGMTQVHLDGRLKLVNQAFADMLGYTKGELTDKSIFDITHPDDLGSTLDARAVFIEGVPKSDVSEKRYLAKNGAVVWGKLSRTPICDASGDIEYFIGQIFDITETKQQAAELERQGVIFEFVFREIPDAMILVNPERKVIHGNPAFTRIFGFEIEEVIGQSASIFYENQEEFDRQGRLQSTLPADEQIEPTVVNYRRKNGIVFPGETIGTAMKTVDGDTLGFLGVIRDISSRIARESALVENEKKFREFTLSAADRFWETDENHRYTFASPTNDLFSSPTSYLLGRTRTEITDFESEEEELERYQNAIKKKQPFRNFRYRTRDIDGRIRFRRSSGVPVFDEDGNFKGYRGGTIDETNEVAARLKAETVQEQFVGAIENMNAGFALWDKDNNFVACNNFFRNLMGEAGKSLTPGIGFRDFINIRASYVERERGIDSKAWSLERHREMALEKSSHESLYPNDRWFRVRQNRLADGSMISLHTDITDIKEHEQQLIDATLAAEAGNRAKSEFLANASHELRTPLSAVLGFAQVMTRNPADINAEKVEKFGKVIRDNSAHLMDLIRDILDVSAVEAGKLELHESEFELRSIIDESVRLLIPRSEGAQVRLINDVSGELPKIKGDSVKIKQIFVNLLTNAIKFTPANGKVMVNAVPKAGEALTVRVVDTGIGMDAEGIVTAMEMFGRVKNATVPASEGTGLGLPLTKGLVEAHGGSFSIDSTPGSGTTVSFTLPAERLLT